MTLVTAIVKNKTTVTASTNSVTVGGDVRVVNSNGSFDNTYTQANSPVTLPNILRQIQTAQLQAFQVMKT